MRSAGAKFCWGATATACYATPCRKPARASWAISRRRLSGVGARLSEGQLRLRIVDSVRLNRDTIMPSYYRMDGLNQVAAAWRGKPVLTAQQVEDVVAYLLTLR